MFRQKNSILINEHPLNREPVPLRTHQLNYHYLQTTFMYLFNLYLTSNYFNFITTAKTTNSYTAQLWALHFFFFHFPLYFIHGRAFQDIYFLHRNSTKCFWIDLVRVLATTGIASLPEIKNVMRTWGIISIIAENKPYAHHKTHLHTIKVYNTRPVSILLIKGAFLWDDPDQNQ